jgi:hypothetical protein
MYSKSIILTVSCAVLVSMASLRAATYKVLTHHDNYRYDAEVDGNGYVHVSGVGHIREYEVVAEPYQSVDITSASGSDHTAYFPKYGLGPNNYNYYCRNEGAVLGWCTVKGMAWAVPEAYNTLGYVFPEYTAGVDGNLSSRESDFFVGSYFFY